MTKSSISKNPELLILIYDVCLLNAFVFIGKIVIKSINNIIDKEGIYNENKKKISKDNVKNRNIYDNIFKLGYWASHILLPKY